MASHEQPSSNSPVVVYIITKLELGGAQKVCLSLVRGLELRDQTAYVISGTEGPLVETAQKLKHPLLLASMTREIGGLRTEWKNFRTLVQELKQLKQLHSTIVVHTHSTKAGLVGRWAAWFAGIKTRIHTVHGYGFHDHQPWLPWLITYALELVTSLITTHFVCVSSADVDTGIRLFPKFKKKSSIIRAAVEQEKFIPATSVINNETFIFGTVTCFKEQKNLFDLLQSFQRVHMQHSNARLEIIGDGILRPKIEQWISDHRLNEAITLHGWQDQVAPIMMHWQSFVLSSLWEGLPCAVVEARLLKLPVLSYKTGGIHDIIHDGINGFLYNQKDWIALADGMCELIENKSLYSRLHNHTDDLQDFYEDAMVHAHAQLYGQLSR